VRRLDNHPRAVPTNPGHLRHRPNDIVQMLNDVREVDLRGHIVPNRPRNVFQIANNIGIAPRIPIKPNRADFTLPGSTTNVNNHLEKYRRHQPPAALLRTQFRQLPPKALTTTNHHPRSPDRGGGGYRPTHHCRLSSAAQSTPTTNSEPRAYQGAMTKYRRIHARLSHHNKLFSPIERSPWAPSRGCPSCRPPTA